MKINIRIGLILLFGLISIFFYKTLFRGLIPFPGDLLISTYKPWRTYSYLGYNPGSYPTKDQYFDTLRQFYPWRNFANEMLSHGKLPLWNPYNFSGAPLLANHQSAIFYPFNIIYIFLPQTIAWTILVFSQHLLAAIFTLLYCRKIRCSLIPSLIASLAFSFSLFFISFSQYVIVGHTILWLPLILLGIELLIEKRNAGSLVLIITSLVFALLAGHLQIFGGVLLASSAYVLFRAKKIWPLFLTCTALSLLISSIQLMPTLELIKFSARSSLNQEFLKTKLLIQPTQLILLLSPDLFGNPATHNYSLNDTYPTNAMFIGLVPFIFVLNAIFLKKTQIAKTVIGLIAFTFLLTVRSPLSELFYSLNIPIISTISPSNFLFVFSFFGSILAALVMDSWIKEKHQINSASLLLPGLLLFALLVLSFRINILLNKRMLLLSLLMFSALAAASTAAKIKILPRKIALIAMLILTWGELFYYFQKFNPFVPSQIVFPEVPLTKTISNNCNGRYWTYGNAQIDANFASLLRLYSPDGYDPLYPKWYGEFIQAANDGRASQISSETRSDAFIPATLSDKSIIDNPYRYKIMNLLSVSCILDRRENASSQIIFPLSGFSFLQTESDWNIFQNLNSYPRVFLAGKYEIYKNKQEFFRRFFDSTFDPKTTLLLEVKPTLDISDDPNAQTTITSYEPNQVIIKTKSRTNQLLFLSDTYYPGWQAFLDGKNQPIMKTHYAFRSIGVPAGLHEIVFRYEPLSLRLGFILSLVGLLTTFGFILYVRRSYGDISE